MKLTFKDLKQQKFVIEAEPSATIAELKAKVEKEKGWESSTQKLIYSGKILQDDKTIESYNIQEKGFVVCMTQKPRSAPSASSSSAVLPSTPAQHSVPTSSAPLAPQVVPSSTTIPDHPATPSPAPAATQERRSDGMVLSSSEREAAIASMEAMGFPREQIEAAMIAAFYNPDRAVEYLLNGIPDNLRRDHPAGNLPRGSAAGEAITSPSSAVPSSDEPVNLFEAAAHAGQGNRGGGTTGRGSTAITGGNLDFLRNNPQFQQLRQIVQQQPQMLEPILQQVGAGNPQLAAMIAERPEEFLRLLAEDHGDDDAALPPGAQAIQVTEEEREAIERLCRLGFERDLVIQAYFACDKNEELAANFLFDQPEDDDVGGQ
ncbi:UV excision repair protein Rad23 [Verruconis gallopava]|uniref:UV excision repair protein RAD23 n=1 Tax=Verruconis gallopava TaxID=253628 RepID=A0A0D1ZX00_9PEZI|nr:UV excision repair protein Rad23 [Verruconis gallopava]KIV98982.1 UV excision repair protein Rad23 [Verruconis gallopava]